MAKLEDLNFAPDEGPGPTDRDRRDADHFLDDIQELRDDDRYLWAEATLRGIYESVSAAGKVSEGQRTAVRNIRDSVLEREERHRTRPSRRYEGW
jgi:hypothetical protein